MTSSVTCGLTHHITKMGKQAMVEANEGSGGSGGTIIDQW